MSTTVIQRPCSILESMEESLKQIQEFKEGKRKFKTLSESKSDWDKWAKEDIKMFEIGDKVKIKSWKQMKKEFGLDKDGDVKCSAGFTWDMKYLCGKEIVINSIDDDEIQDIDDWTISFDMIGKI